MYNLFLEAKPLYSSINVVNSLTHNVTFSFVDHIFCLLIDLVVRYGYAT